MTILLSDPRVSAIPVLDGGEPLIPLDATFGPARALVRQGLAERLLRAQAALPPGTALRVVEGHRTIARQREIIAAYTVEVRVAQPGVSPSELERLTSRFVAPVGVAPHVAGAAVDLTLIGPDAGRAGPGHTHRRDAGAVRRPLLFRGPRHQHRPPGRIATCWLGCWARPVW